MINIMRTKTTMRVTRSMKKMAIGRRNRKTKMRTMMTMKRNSIGARSNAIRCITDRKPSRGSRASIRLLRRSIKNCKSKITMRKSTTRNKSSVLIVIDTIST